MREIIPVPVYEAIARHLRSSGRSAQKSWETNRAAEDALTGAAFAEFTTYRTRHHYAGGHEWRWRVKAYKFVSGGEGSEEKNTGADGIIELEVHHFATGQVETKALLVQAKKIWTGRNKKLLDQVKDMESLAKGGSAALDYLPTGYIAVSGREVLVAEGDFRRVPRSEVVPLGEFLADRFLACEVGTRGLYYEPRRHLLHIPPSDVSPDAVLFLIRERLRIEVEEMRQ
jgi:hypothetical protein